MRPSLSHKVGVVTDEQGRQRFHGAFTGGFSAGYYNTVGSAEGFTPKTFVSSRNNRADKKSYTALDFMDNEDGILTGKLSSKEEYDMLDAAAKFKVAKAAAELGAAHTPLLSGALPPELLLQPSKSIGKQLLRTMGWREGQGIGPRQRTSIPKGASIHAIPSSALESSSASTMNLSSGDGTDSSLVVTLAAQVVSVKIPPPKVDTIGIGYVRSAQEMMMYTASRQLERSTRGREQTNRLATSVNNARQKQSSSSKLSLYDDDEDPDNVYDDVDEDAVFDVYAEITGAISHIGAEMNQAAMVPVQRCPSDGKYVLASFVLGSGSGQLTVVVDYAPIPPPQGFIPKPSKYLKPIDGDTGSASQVSSTVTAIAELRRHGADRISLMRGSMLDSTTKQESRPMLTAPDVFQTAFAGLSQAFKSRFVSSSSVSEPEIKPGLVTASEHANSIKSESMTNMKSSSVSTSNQSITTTSKHVPSRITVSWAPSPLLCKRFNVAVPTIVESTSTSSKTIPNIPSRVDDLFNANIGKYLAPASFDHPIPEANPNPTAEDSIIEEPKIVKPPMALFKSIFADSDSDSDGDSDSETESEPESTKEIDSKPVVNDQGKEASNVAQTNDLMSAQTVGPSPSSIMDYLRTMANSISEPQVADFQYNAAPSSEPPGGANKIIFKRPATSSTYAAKPTAASVQFGKRPRFGGNSIKRPQADEATMETNQESSDEEWGTVKRPALREAAPRVASIKANPGWAIEPVAAVDTELIPLELAATAPKSVQDSIVTKPSPEKSAVKVQQDVSSLADNEKALTTQIWIPHVNYQSTLSKLQSAITASSFEKHDQPKHKKNKKNKKEKKGKKEKKDKKGKKEKKSKGSKSSKRKYKDTDDDDPSSSSSSSSEDDSN